MKKSKHLYTRSLKLGPALGDWTTLQFRDPSLDEVDISPVIGVNFDSFPKEVLNFLHYQHYQLAEHLIELLSKDLDVKVELHTVTAAQTSFENFLDSIEDKMVQIDGGVSNLGQFNVFLDWSLANMLVNRLVGGQGEETAGDTFSAVEETILESQFRRILTPFNDQWQLGSVDDVDLKIRSGEVDYDAKLALREAYVVFYFQFYFGQNNLVKMTWAYPNALLRELLARNPIDKSSISQTVWLNQKTTEDVKVPINGILGQSILSMKDLQNLSENDVIVLDKKINEPIVLNFGENQLLTQIGYSRERLCLQVIKGQIATQPKSKPKVVEPQLTSEPEESAVMGLAVESEPEPDPESVTDTMVSDEVDEVVESPESAVDEVGDDEVNEEQADTDYEFEDTVLDDSLDEDLNAED